VLAEAAHAHIEEARESVDSLDHAPLAAYLAKQADLAREVLARLRDGRI
jgi:hypothetical protein